MTMRVGLLGLQGAFRDHLPPLKRLGAECRIVADIDSLMAVDRLILPGGESTVMTKFLNAYAMTAPLVERIADGMPVWGVCAGSILLAETVDGHPGVLGVLGVSAARNAYGRQLASTDADIPIPGLSLERFHAIFIRSPRLAVTGAGVDVLAVWNRDPVFLRQQRVMATTFHPELTDSLAIHRYFLSL